MNGKETRSIFPADIEYRRRGRSISGRIPYGERHKATIRDRGRVRKEFFTKRAHSYAVEKPERQIHLLSGHDYNRPLANKLNGSLTLKDSDDALTFKAQLPPESEQPSWMVDQVLALRSGLIGGLSIGFSIPPKSAVADAVRLVPEPGNPGVYMRRVSATVLHEISLVSLPAYKSTEVELREDELLEEINNTFSFDEKYRLWL